MIKFSKDLLILAAVLMVVNLKSQDTSSYFQRIKEVAMPMIIPLKNGDIGGLEKATPPKDTWSYSKLLDYKKILSEGNDSIYYGSFIEPAAIDGMYGVNFFALSKYDKQVNYYFVAVISVDAREEKFHINNSYLFTEEKSLKNWWTNTYQFYKSGDLEKIPKGFLHPVCPPPPSIFE